MDANLKPSAELYGLFQTVYDKFNIDLFESKLPEVVITLQREKGTMGYFSKDRWYRGPTNKKVHELALNPSFFLEWPLIEVLQTLAHEQCHVLQHEYGNPGRGRYHNAEFSQMMEKIGLMTSDTGRPGGKRTGQRMADYPLKGGRFAQACLDLHNDGFFLPWIDRVAVPNHSRIQHSRHDSDSRIQPGELSSSQQAFHQYQAADLEVLYVDLVPEELQASVVVRPDDEAINKRNSKTKYTCRCNFNIWGKPGLNIHCKDCDSDYISVN